MPKLAVPLNDTQIRRAKAGAKPLKLYDGAGLYLEIQTSGAKFWRFRYRQSNGKENSVTFGAYPQLTLAEARVHRENARKLMIDGYDIGQQKALVRRQTAATAAQTFRALAIEWHAVKTVSWSPQYAANVLHRLEMDIFPDIGSVPIADVTHRDLIGVLRKIESRGAHEVAKRNKAVCSQIFSYAIQAGAAARNPLADMRDVLQLVTPGNFPAISSDQLPAFLATMRANNACMSPITRIGLQLLMLVFVRTSELIETPWDEIVPGSDSWTIPWQRMKLGKRRLNPIKKDHYVPLSRQARGLIEELRQLTGGGRYMFPNMRDHSRPISNNAFLKAIERMGYKGLMSGHGFRAVAMSTIKEKLGYRHEVVDRQLAHVHKDKVTRAYDRAEFLNERGIMMQAWADYIDSL